MRDTNALVSETPIKQERLMLKITVDDINLLQELLARVENITTAESTFCWRLLKKLDKIEEAHR